jgi:hypothetical protein
MRRAALAALLALSLSPGVAHAGKPAPIDGTVFVHGSSQWGATVYPVVTLSGSLRPQQDLSLMLLCYQGDPRELVSMKGHNLDQWNPADGVQVPTVSNFVGADVPVIDVAQPGRCRVSLLLSTDKGQTRTSAELDQHDWFDVAPSS